MFYKKKWLVNHHKLLLTALGLLTLLFITSGFFKPTFINRQYWLQGIVGITRHPYGVGVGNFGELSADPRNHLFGLKSFSSVAHNLPLEIVAGLGIFGLYFVWWLYHVVKQAINQTKSSTITFTAAFVALSTNFLFDNTYFIPSMLWLWFLLLGLIEQKSETQSPLNLNSITLLISGFLLLSSLWLALI